MKAETSRRGVLAGGSAALGASLVAGCGRPAIAGTLDGANWQRGHLLRDGGFPAPEGPVEQVGVVIAGGGVAGLAAGWRLAEAGFTDFTLFELEDSIGGNARAGRNAVSAYPLGAHYLPVPNREATALRHMLRGFGMIVGDMPDGPVYDPYQLCADLEERLLWRGEWQEGLFPNGLPAPEQAQRRAFDARMDAFRKAIGTDGRPAFAVPSALSSTDPRFTALDRQTFAAWLDAEGFTAPALRAYLRYCCRDDYGAEPEHVSAWAGIHYFAGRRGWAANGDGDRELTWPEGNGRLATMMASSIRSQLRSGHSVFRVAARPDGSAEVDVFDHRARRSRRFHARAAILAMPHFVAAHVAPVHCAKGGFSYAPWVVANVTVSRHPAGKGVSLAWDNVSTASDALGYVVATHQSAGTDAGPTVLTWYMPLSRETPQEARRIMLTRSLERWQDIVQADLLAMNPDLDGAIERIDMWRWGHAMVRPTPGFLSDPARLAARDAKPPVLFAHSDLSGLSLFEEAHHHGVVAAEAALAHLGYAYEELAST